MYGLSFQNLIPKVTGSQYPDSKSIWVLSKKKHLLITDLKCTSSLRNTRSLLAKRCPIRRDADGQLGFLLHTITGFLRPSLTHYYGFICHLTPTFTLSFLLMSVSGTRPDAVPGFPSYCADALLTMPPSSTA